MKSISQFDFRRGRGIVWACDIQGSSSYMNDDQTVDALERFLPRLYWTAVAAVDAVGGTFVKWTGDGFLAWFETPLLRELPTVAVQVLGAASQIGMLVQATQLGVKGDHRFVLRQGIAFEEDALIIQITHSEHHKSLDLIGRAVVLACRLAGIGGGFLGIVTQERLVDAATKVDPSLDFQPFPVDAETLQKTFKGETWGTEGLCQSMVTLPANRSAADTQAMVQDVIDHAEGRHEGPRHRLDFTRRFFAALETGPEWCKAVIDEYASISRQLHEALLHVAEALSKGELSGEGDSRTPE